MNRAGIDATAHDLRDSFVSHLIYLGYSLEDVSKIAGHSTIKVTERHYYEQLQERWRSMLADLGSYLVRSQPGGKTEAVEKTSPENG
ncbi:MAG: tyrosine-type recombinase/integrase [Candidatus Marinimicrobia bacterium]|nr:tyrosine-type recombinase/integrase [Candidatus Neomarinimicrobiota bacterium]